MSAHTPTEWEWDGDAFVYALNLEGSNRFFCGIQPGWSTQGRTRTDHAELVANARLIAAAPDLLEALIEADRILGNLGCDPENSPRAEARAAIAKATGAE